MMSWYHEDYASAAEWLEAVIRDDAWQGQKEQLEMSTAADIAMHREDAARRIGSGLINEYWMIHRNNANRVELVVTEVWGVKELTLPKLKLQAIGMLTMEWIDAHPAGTKSAAPQAEINFFAPKKSLQELLKQDWLAEIRADEKYDVDWTGAFIEALMSSPFGNQIACDWDDHGRHGKCTQIKGYILGLLKDEGVLKGSYDSIATRVGLTDEPRTFSRYMGQGKKQPYAAWVKESVAGNFSSLTEKNAQTFGS